MAKPVSAKGSWVKSDVKLTGKTVIITGANTGIGLETAIDLSKREAKVIMACRNMEKANQARTRVSLQLKLNAFCSCLTGYSNILLWVKRRGSYYWFLFSHFASWYSLTFFIRFPFIFAVLFVDFIQSWMSTAGLNVPWPNLISIG